MTGHRCDCDYCGYEEAHMTPEQRARQLAKKWMALKPPYDDNEEKARVVAKAYLAILAEDTERQTRVCGNCEKWTAYEDGGRMGECEWFSAGDIEHTFYCGDFIRRKGAKK